MIDCSADVTMLPYTTIAVRQHRILSMVFDGEKDNEETCDSRVRERWKERGTILDLDQDHSAVTPLSS